MRGACKYTRRRVSLKGIMEPWESNVPICKLPVLLRVQFQGIVELAA